VIGVATYVVDHVRYLGDRVCSMRCGEVAVSAAIIIAPMLDAGSGSGSRSEQSFSKGGATRMTQSYCFPRSQTRLLLTAELKGLQRRLV
jgi:hypothetical protein